MKMMGSIIISFWIVLSLVSLTILVRSFVKPLNADSEKLAATKRLLLFNAWVFLAAVGVSIQALISKNYFLLFAGVILLTFIHPVAVQYFRLKRVLKRS